MTSEQHAKLFDKIIHAPPGPVELSEEEVLLILQNYPNPAAPQDWHQKEIWRFRDPGNCIRIWQREVRLAPPKTTGETMHYSFYVKHAPEIDFNRITKEAPPECNAILLTSSTDGAVLLLRSTWLERFDERDSIHVLSGPLHDGWGMQSLSAFNMNKGIQFVLSDHPPNGWYFLQAWRAHGFLKTDIPAMIEQLRAARQSKSPPREVRVAYV